jgi:hypothetical protein
MPKQNTLEHIIENSAPVSHRVLVEIAHDGGEILRKVRVRVEHAADLRATPLIDRGRSAKDETLNTRLGDMYSNSNNNPDTKDAERYRYCGKFNTDFHSKKF